MEMTLLIGLDAASYILTLLLVCIGLVVIFGMMNVINLAHGEFFLLGAYTVVLLQQYALPFAVILVVAFAFVALVGLIIEELVIRRIYHRFLDTILATWGISLALKQLVIVLFGPGSQQAVAPFAEPIAMFGITYSSYRLFVMGMAIIITASNISHLVSNPVGPDSARSDC